MSAANITTGTLSAARGGTGVSNNAAATITITGSNPVAITPVASCTYTPTDVSASAAGFTINKAGCARYGGMVMAWADVTMSANANANNANFGGLPVAIPSTFAYPCQLQGWDASVAVPVMPSVTTTSFIFINPATGTALTEVALTGRRISWMCNYPDS